MIALPGRGVLPSTLPNRACPCQSHRAPESGYPPVGYDFRPSRNVLPGSFLRARIALKCPVWYRMLQIETEVNMKPAIHSTLSIALAASGFLHQAHAADKLPERTEPPSKPSPRASPPASSPTPSPAPAASPAPAPAPSPFAYKDSIAFAHCAALDAAAQGKQSNLSELKKNASTAEYNVRDALGKITVFSFVSGSDQSRMAGAQRSLSSAQSARDVQTAMGQVQSAITDLAATGNRCRR